MFKCVNCYATIMIGECDDEDCYNELADFVAEEMEVCNKTNNSGDSLSVPEKRVF